ncbi:hypothetical protein SYNPS1DRAFT_30827 [Syncephalis pseudoplumigaleata]|uniref:Uncharacterized protein n=1 Tax=Syncephalis pseudoplumigaleata TaxID=1712513 RepID=A0A4P9YU02_9FUNG|nr:hypothetical protein SYNPS1DRAFT_30827 [Syncephalis pseudoplumigaleata]|eukprot:RKP23426.1 hypothetical protein SYNPS1DRAFT_30827 [Syncephalis pseudoplumigaleata]
MHQYSPSFPAKQHSFSLPHSSSSSTSTSDTPFSACMHGNRRGGDTTTSRVFDNGQPSLGGRGGGRGGARCMRVGKRSHADASMDDYVMAHAAPSKRLCALFDRSLTLNTEHEPVQLGMKRKLTTTDDGSMAAAPHATPDAADPLHDMKRLRAHANTTMAHDDASHNGGSVPYWMPHHNTRVLSMDTWEPLPPIAIVDAEDDGEQQQQQPACSAIATTPSSTSSLTLVPWYGKTTASPRLPDKIIMPSGAQDTWWHRGETASPLSMRYWSPSDYAMGHDHDAGNAVVLYRPNGIYTTSMYSHGDDDGDDGYCGPIIEELPAEEDDDGAHDSKQRHSDDSEEEQDRMDAMSLD